MLRLVVILSVAASALAAQGAVASIGVVPPDRALWFLLRVEGVETQDIVIDIHVAVSGPVQGRVLDLDQYARLEGTYEAASVSAAGAVDLSLNLSPRKQWRNVAIELRHPAAGAPAVDYTMSITVLTGTWQIRKLENVPIAEFGMICLFNRMVLFDAAYDPGQAGKCFKVHVESDTMYDYSRLAVVLQVEQLSSFAIADEYWTGNGSYEPDKKTRELLRESPMLPVVEVRATALLAKSGSNDYMWHTIYMSRPDGDPNARIRGEAVFGGVSWVSEESRYRRDSWGEGCGAAIIGRIDDWTRLGPMAALAAGCVSAVIYLRRRRPALRVA